MKKIKPSKNLPAKAASFGLELQLPPQNATAVERINFFHQASKQLSEYAVRCAVAAGIELQRAKASIEHGEFGKWITKNCNFSERTAQNYMKLAEELLEDNMPKLLAAESGNYLGEVEKALEKAPVKGRTLAELYADYGVIKSAPNIGGARENAGRKKALTSEEVAKAMFEPFVGVLNDILTKKHYGAWSLAELKTALDKLTQVREEIKRTING